MPVVELEGKDVLIRELKGLRGDVLRCIKLVERPLSDAVYGMVRGQYRSYGRQGPTGRPWTRKESTVRGYTAVNRRSPTKLINWPMRRTDALFVSETTRGAPHGIYIVDDLMIALGTDLFYGWIQQERGQKQYDPTEENIREFGRIIERGQVTKIADRGFDWKDTGEIPF